MCVLSNKNECKIQLSGNITSKQHGSKANVFNSFYLLELGICLPKMPFEHPSNFICNFKKRLAILSSSSFEQFEFIFYPFHISNKTVF